MVRYFQRMKNYFGKKILKALKKFRGGIRKSVKLTITIWVVFVGGNGGDYPRHCFSRSPTGFVKNIPGRNSFYLMHCRNAWNISPSGFRSIRFSNSLMSDIVIVGKKIICLRRAFVDPTFRFCSRFH